MRASGAQPSLCDPCRQPEPLQEVPMAKRGRKRRGRKKNAANHGKRPNA